MLDSCEAGLFSSIQLLVVTAFDDEKIGSANAVAEDFKVATLLTSAGDDMYMI